MKLLPVMLCFFAMGFVDLVGIATNYIKADLNLTDMQANLLPSLVFFWFLIFSLPTSLLMNKIGRKKTVLISLGVTVVSLIVPVFSGSYPAMLVSFSLLGIGNTLMQVSLNPLVSNLITGNKLASTLTLGQFVKAIASFIAPLLAAWGAVHLGYWQLLFPIFAVISVLAILALGLTSIRENAPDQGSSSFKACFSLLRYPLILFAFIGIMCHVGIDVGTNVTAPKLLMERLGFTLADAGFATSIYFLARTLGCFTGSILLARMSSRKFFFASVVLMLAGMGGLFFFESQLLIYACVALIGLGNSNIFPIIFSQALHGMPTHQNEVSGLMIMGLFGGTVFPLAMGFASDLSGSQVGAVLVMSLGVFYLLYLATRIKK